MIADAQAQTAQRTVENDGQLKFTLDSGATDYMVNKKSYFNNLKRISPISIAIAKDGESLVAKERGDITVKTFQDDDNSSRIMDEVLYVKDLKCNLMSIDRLCDKGYEVTFKKDGATITKDGQAQFKAYRNGSLYEVDFKIEKNVFAGIANETLNKFSQTLWHSRLCHLNVFHMKKLITEDMEWRKSKGTQ